MGKSKKTTTISGIKNNRGKLSPILVNFEHGTVNPEAFNAFDAKIKIGLPEGQNENSIHADEPQLKLEIKSDHMKYSSTAKSLNGNGVRYDPYYSTYIGIRNKEDGPLKLFEIETRVANKKYQTMPTNCRMSRT